MQQADLRLRLGVEQLSGLPAPEWCQLQLVDLRFVTQLQRVQQADLRLRLGKERLLGLPEASEWPQLQQVDSHFVTQLQRVQQLDLKVAPVKNWKQRVELGVAAELEEGS